MDGEIMNDVDADSGDAAMTFGEDVVEIDKDAPSCSVLTEFGVNPTWGVEITDCAGNGLFSDFSPKYKSFLGSDSKVEAPTVELIAFETNNGFVVVVLYTG